MAGDDDIDPNAAAAPLAWPPPSWDVPAGAQPGIDWPPPAWGAPLATPDVAGPPPVDASLAGAPPPQLDTGPVPTVPGPLAPPPPAPSGVAGLPDFTIHTEQPGELPVPDAVTGAGGAPGFGDAADKRLTPDQRYQQVAQDYAAHPDALLDKITNGAIDPETQRYLNDFARRDPAGFSELNLRLADAKMKRAAADQHRIADADYQTQQQNLAMRDKAIRDAQAKSAQLDADAQRIANTKIDPTGGMSVPQRLAGLVAAVVGGLYQGRTGSARNPGLDALNDVINRNIETQKADLASQREGLQQRRGALAEEYARTGDLYQAAEVTRLAALKHADELLATQQQDYAPEGTRGLQIAQMRAGVQAQQAQAMQAYQQKQFDDSIKLQGVAREQQLADETRRHNRATESAEWAKIGESKSKEGPRYTPEQLKVLFGPEAVVPPPGTPPMAVKDYHAWQEAHKENLDISSKNNATVIRDPNTFEPLVGKEGQPARAGDATIADKTNERLSQGQRFVDVLSDINRDLDADPSSLDYKKFAAIKTKYENAKKDLIKSVGSNYTSREVEAVDDMFGGGFDGFTQRFLGRGKAQARIRALIDNAAQDTVSEIGTKFGVKIPTDASGKQTLIRDTSQPETRPKTPIERAAEQLNTNTWQLDSGEVPGEDREWAMARNLNLPSAQEYISTPEGHRTAATGLPPSKLRIFDELSADALGPDLKKRKDALSVIVEQANNGPNEALRGYARQILTNVITHGINTTPGEQP